MAKASITTTKNYSLFDRSSMNRDTNLGKHKNLINSMKKYGFLKCFPVVCTRNKSKRLEIIDGQHRFQIAEMLGLPITYTESEVEFNIAEVNSTSKTWTVADYCHMYAQNGKVDYQEAIEFCDLHEIPISLSLSLLAGTTSFTNINKKFLVGEYKVKDRVWAEKVASLYVPMITLSSELKNRRFIEACMRVCRVDGFDRSRMLSSAKKCREKLVSYSTVDAFMDMLEVVYNYGRQKHVGLKAESANAMKSRNACAKSEAAA